VALASYLKNRPRLGEEGGGGELKRGIKSGGAGEGEDQPCLNCAGNLRVLTYAGGGREREKTIILLPGGTAEKKRYKKGRGKSGRRGGGHDYTSLGAEGEDDRQQSDRSWEVSCLKRQGISCKIYVKKDTISREGRAVTSWVLGGRSSPELFKRG